MWVQILLFVPNLNKKGEIVMKEQIKIMVKNSSIKERNGEVLVSEMNNKGEVVSEVKLQDIYDKISDKNNLKFQISSNDVLSFEEVKNVLDSFIGKESISFNITNEVEF